MLPNINEELLEEAKTFKIEIKGEKTKTNSINESLLLTISDLKSKAISEREKDANQKTDKRHIQENKD